MLTKENEELSSRLGTFFNKRKHGPSLEGVVTLRDLIKRVRTVHLSYGIVSLKYSLDDKYHLCGDYGSLYSLTASTHPYCPTLTLWLKMTGDTEESLMIARKLILGWKEEKENFLNKKIILPENKIDTDRYVIGGIDNDKFVIKRFYHPEFGLSIRRNIAFKRLIKTL